MECDTPGWVQHLQRMPYEAAADIHTNVPDTEMEWPTIGEKIQLEVQGITKVDWVHHVVIWNWAKTGLDGEDFTELLLDCFMGNTATTATMATSANLAMRTTTASTATVLDRTHSETEMEQPTERCSEPATEFVEVNLSARTQAGNDIEQPTERCSEPATDIVEENLSNLTRTESRWTLTKEPLSSRTLTKEQLVINYDAVTAQETGLGPNGEAKANAHEAGLESRDPGANHHEETGLDDHIGAFTRFLIHKRILFQKGREERDKLLEDRLMDKTWIQAKLVLECENQHSTRSFYIGHYETDTSAQWAQHTGKKNDTDTSAQWANKCIDPTILYSMTIPDQGSNKADRMRSPGHWTRMEDTTTC